MGEFEWIYTTGLIFAIIVGQLALKRNRKKPISLET